ncbi:MAG: PqiC family protein [Desulfobacterales bacterium]|jgi:uncharacterized lipoprotein YmbA
MRYNRFVLVVLMPAGLLFLLTGCLAPAKSSPTRFYILTSIYSEKVKPAPVADLKNAAIGVGPVRVSGKLDRPQIVTSTGDNEIRLSDFADWGDSLGAGFSRVLAENLSYLLNTTNVSIFPWLQAIQTDYQVTVDLTDFIGTPGGDVMLRAWWTIFGENGRTELLKRFTILSEPVEGDDIAAMVQTQSRMLEMLSRQIAETIKALSQSTEHKDDS